MWDCEAQTRSRSLWNTAIRKISSEVNSLLGSVKIVYSWKKLRGSCCSGDDNILTERCWNGHSGVKWAATWLYVPVFLYTVFSQLSPSSTYISPLHCFPISCLPLFGRHSFPLVSFPPFLPLLLFVESGFSLFSFFCFFVFHLYSRHSLGSFFHPAFPMFRVTFVPPSSKNNTPSPTNPLTHWPLQIANQVRLI